MDFTGLTYNEIAAITGADTDKQLAEESAFYGREHLEFFLDEVEIGGAQYEKAATKPIEFPW